MGYEIQGIDNASGEWTHVSVHASLEAAKRRSRKIYRDLRVSTRIVHDGRTVARVGADASDYDAPA